MTKKTRSLIYVLSVLSAGALLMALLTSFKSEPAKLEELAQVRTVDTAPLVSARQILWIEEEGFLASPRTLTILSAAAGRVDYTWQGLKGGTPVEEGQLLVKLDDRRARLAFESARTNMLHLTNQFVTVAAMATGEEEKWKSYVGRLRVASFENIPSLPETDMRLYQLAVTKGVLQASYNLESSALDLADHEIRAPFGGVLSGSGLPHGSWVSPGVHLGELVETNPLELALALPLREWEHLETGMEARLEGPGGEILTGRLERKEPFLQSRSQAARVYISVPFIEGEEWPAGSYVKARLQGQVLEEAYRIPREVLIGEKIPLFAKGQLELRDVDIEGTDGKDVIFTADLPGGSEYVVTTLQNPLEGMLLEKEER